MNLLIITGGSRGIGKASVSKFLENKWQIINISRSVCDIAGVTNVSMDLAEVDENHIYLPDLIKHANKISLVHNAGFYKKGHTETLSLDSLRQTLEVNIVAAVALNKQIIPYMKAGSSILYIGSTLSEQAAPSSVAYVVSKHALVGLMRSTALDLAEKLITSCCICPGLVNTDMLHGTMDEKTMKWFLDHKVMGKRLIEPKEIAELIYFCATNPVMNDAVIHANLGQVSV